MDISLDTQRGKWLKLHFIAVLLLMLYAISGPLEPYDGSLAFEKMHIVFCSVVFAFYFYFRRLDTSVEARLLLIFGVWLYITRALNMDIFLIEDFNLVFDILFCYVIMDTGMLLDRKQRESLFDWICVACSVVFTILGILSLVAALLQKTIVMPITGRELMLHGSGTLKQLYVFDKNPNCCGIWFTITAGLMACQFIKCKHRLWRIPIVLVILINYFALTVTFSRNCMLAFSIGCALLGMLALMVWLKSSKKWLRVLATLASTVILLVGVYKSFDVSADLISKASIRLTSPKDAVSDVSAAPASSGDTALQEAAPSDAAPAQLPEEPIYSDNRDLATTITTLSNRIPIYQSAFYTFKVQPKRLIIGCTAREVMSVSNTVITRIQPHLHSTYLQALALTGIPGFLLLMTFVVLLVVRMVRLFFSEEPGAEIWVKAITAPLAGLLTYNLLETTFLHYFDFRGEMIFFLAGILLGFYYEIYPAQKKPKKQKPDPSSPN